MRGYAVTHPPGHADFVIEPGWDQVISTVAGVITVTAANTKWTVPADRAVWIPADIEAAVDNSRTVSVRAVYFRPGVLGGELDDVTRSRASRHPVVLNLGSFDRALIEHVIGVAPLYEHASVDRALTTVLLDRLRTSTAASLALPLPGGELGREFRYIVDVDPGLASPVVARRLAVSLRTLERHVRSETGLSVGAWRRRARILSSLDELGEKGSVTRAAAAAGYSTPSAYVTAFRHELGTTPRRFMYS